MDSTIQSRTLIIGGTGLLGTNLKKLDKSAVCTGREFTVDSLFSLLELFEEVKPTLVINAAAEINSVEIEEDPMAAISTNIIGAANVAKCCLIYECRLVYISTDYIFPGGGNHKENEPILPVNNYAWTKLGGECSSRLVENSLIIRTSFGADNFPYESAYSNLYTSKDYVDIIAPKILKAARSSVQGILNIGTERKSVYEYAKKRNKGVKQNKLNVDKDFSLNTDFYDRIFNNQ